MAPATFDGIDVALVGTYPPTQCGLATFAASLREGLLAGGCRTVGMIRVAPGEVASGRRAGASSRPGADRSEVVACWDPDASAQPTAALRAATRHDAVIVQHEFGIYGADDGAAVVGFLRRCEVPRIVVLHTVLASPSPGQLRVLAGIVAHSEIVVVQSEAARTRLLHSVAVPATKLAVIPHGAAVELGGEARKLVDAPTVLTWGLLGPGKGIEHAITAFARIGTLVPQPVYVVLGGTHPKVRATEGERYRDGLVALAHQLGVAPRVMFDDAYRSGPELRTLVRGADVVVLPYDSHDQVTSGVLVEAIAAARPVVATAFPHAVELLGGGAGIVVRHGDPDALASGIRRVLTTPRAAIAMRERCRAMAADLAWPAVGARYARLATEVLAARAAA